MPQPTPLPPGVTPPVGGAPIAAPSPSPGMEAAAMAKVASAVKILQEAFPGVPAEGEAGKAILKAIQQLTKVAPVAKTAPGVGAESMRGLARQATQEAPLAALLRQQASGSGSPPAEGAGPPAM